MIAGFAAAPPYSQPSDLTVNERVMALDIASKPRRKNPVLRTPLPTLPPGKRSRAALGLTAAATRGRLELQVCQDCGATQYPPREICGTCLSHRLVWRAQDGRGELTTETVLRTAQELFFRERTPWRVGTVRLDAGVNVIAYVHERVGAAPCRLRVAAALDRAGQGVLVALPEHGTSRPVGGCQDARTHLRSAVAEGPHHRRQDPRPARPSRGRSPRPAPS